MFCFVSSCLSSCGSGCGAILAYMSQCFNGICG